MDQEEILLSICIPTYNRSAYLKELVDSISVSIVGYEDMTEVVISDNCSTDNTRELIENLRQKYNWISYHVNNENLGISKNFYIVASMAKGEYIWIIGDDDKIEPRAINNIVNLIKDNYDLIHCNNSIWNKEMNQIHSISGYSRIARDMIFRTKNDFLETFGVLVGYISTVIIKRNIFLKADYKTRSKFFDTFFPNVFSIYYGLANTTKIIYITDPIVMNRSGNVRFSRTESEHIFVEGISSIFRELLNYGYSENAVKSAMKQVYIEYIISPKSLNIHPSKLLTNPESRLCFKTIEDNDFVRALKYLKIYEEINDNSLPYLWDMDRLGGKFSLLFLGEVWLKLGDKITASEYYYRAFSEDERISDDIIKFAIAKYFNNPKELYNKIETKIKDPTSYENYVYYYCLNEFENANLVINRFLDIYIDSPIVGKSKIIMAKMILHRIKGIREMIEYLNAYPTSDNIFMFGLYLLDIGNIKEGAKILSNFSNGIYLLRVLASVNSSDGIFQFDIMPLIYELLAMNTKNILIKLLPYAYNREKIINIIEFTPMENILYMVDWKGETNDECIFNSRKMMAIGNNERALDWLRSSRRFYLTVRQIILEIELSLKYNNFKLAVKMLEFGLIIYPDSVSLQRLSEGIYRDNYSLHYMEETEMYKYIDVFIEFITSWDLKSLEIKRTYIDYLISYTHHIQKKYTDLIPAVTVKNIIVILAELFFCDYNFENHCFELVAYVEHLNETVYFYV